MDNGGSLPLLNLDFSQKFSPESDLGLLLRTTNFAAIKHKNQRRKDPEKTPYINHPVGVAHILAAEGGVTDITVLQAAVLHDTVEDTDTTLDEIEQHFGAHVRSIVAEVTDNKALAPADRKRQQIEKAPHVSFQAKLVKLADKLYNLRDLYRTRPEGWPEERAQQYFVWAGRVIEGLLGTNQPIEDKLRVLLAEKGVLLPTERPSA
ncbi:guanosine-3',5'-bis(diphosphate) 3'-pyrophosphohydrolase MESH1-like [Paramacrobiotus metropolitanus]|uniref:guanosine-3',5'-bis(diphosphate) 3'-pyrophosphohydrolase MESH1-like n=1 Tax=Paramacrobiotus metropolitanus TaxID=2943436 RepID=UPI0024464A03|nr:guanosine-3',5'-bis(diphosphate) 3'-pyrophosphohydrolase MESH1-like [Paramacrobiotus metropolitanus]